MSPKQKNILITEFVVQVYSDRVDWGGAEHLIWWLLNRKPREGFLPHADEIHRLGDPSRRRKSA